MRRTLLALCLLAALPSLWSRAAAQEAAPALQEDPRAARFREVERGFFTTFEVGYLHLLETPVADPVSFPYAGTDGGAASGLYAGLVVGYDITPRLAFSLFAWQGNATASPSYGAFNFTAAGADVRFAFLGTRDSNEVERLYVYLHGRGGYVWTYPKGLFGDTDVLAQGGLGLEYYTRLRHFSVGLVADYLYFTEAKASGFSVVPTLRYTF
ncbi:MAG TPA: adventurous gliding motility protein CglE [Anaeromyxobacteraceae bacterium]|nr:adventurous gliding motility protein CglE [Anaeromyxobacteraceae bacterium]